MLGGTVGTIHLGHEATRGFDPVATAVEECYGTTRSLKSNTRHCLKYSTTLLCAIMIMTRYLVVPLLDVLLIVSVGQSVSSNGWREYQDIVRRMVATRFTSTYLTLFRSNMKSPTLSIMMANANSKWESEDSYSLVDFA